MSNLSATQSPEGQESDRHATATGAGIHLPQSLTTFIGREQDVETARALLLREDVRLLTLIGPGGVGKTRLALEVARSVGTFRDGVWFVELAAVHDPALVVPAIASTLGVMPNASRSAEQNLAAHLRDRRALIVLDNLEQVLDAAVLIPNLLSRCPGLKFIVTSRSVLQVSGEHTYTVPSLRMPDSNRYHDIDELRSVDAVRLFVERAQARVPGFALTERNAPSVASLCERLDGLPLAIELAAARVNALSPADLLHRLDTRLMLLTGGARDQPGRLRSLRESIAWSYDLLSPGEQVLFRRLGVFAGPWTLDAAEAVIHGGEESLGMPVLDGVASLVDKHLVRHQIIASGQSQYQLLETVREFATELLDGSDDAVPARHRLTAYLVALADGIILAWSDPRGAERSARLEMHAADVWAGLARTEQEGDVEALGCLATSLAMLQMRGHNENSRSWLERAVELGRAASSPTLGRTMISLANFFHGEGDEQRAWECALEGVTLLEEHDDREYLFVGYTECALIAQRSNAVVEAEAYHQRALAAISLLTDVPWAPFAESGVLTNLGNNAIQQGKIASAKSYFERAVAPQVSMGYPPGTSHYAASHAVAGLGDVARGEQDHEAALAHFQRAIGIAHELGDYRATVYALGGIAATLACIGQWQDAARLFGADEALHQRADIHFGLETLDRQRALGLPEPWFRGDEPFGSGQHIHDALWAEQPPPYPPIPDRATAAALWIAGRALSLSDAVSEALTATSTPTPPANGADVLSPRELEVLRHLTAGESDADIANALFISRRTAATHIAHIYNKLGISSRAEAAAWAVRKGIA